MPRGMRLAALITGGWLASAFVAVQALSPEPAPAPADVRPPGQRLYARHCLSCHQADGGGVPNMQPPIAGGTWVQGDARALALFVMSGGFDSASRKDSDVGNVMPPFRQLADADLAGILTYIREKFGNGASPVSAAEVADARSSLPSP
ncbi:MAG TPA: cytochrome c [Steroidobacteraceae bacterium]|nr:cytochrome c [Steroidobacteraceae bacterium]